MQTPPPLPSSRADQISRSTLPLQDVTSAEDLARQASSQQRGTAEDETHRDDHAHRSPDERHGHAQQNGRDRPNWALLGTAPGELLASRTPQHELRHSSGSAQHSSTRLPLSKQAATKTGLPALTAAGQRLEELQAMQKAKDFHKQQQRAMLTSDKQASRRLLQTADSERHQHSRKHASDRHSHTCSRRNLRAPAEARPSSRYKLTPTSDAQYDDTFSYADAGLGTVYSNDGPASQGILNTQQTEQKEALFFTGLSDLQSAGGQPNPLLASLDQIHDTGFSDFEERPQQRLGVATQQGPSSAQRPVSHLPHALYGLRGNNCACVKALHERGLPSQLHITPVDGKCATMTHT